MDLQTQERMRLIEEELARRQSITPPVTDSNHQKMEAIAAELARRGVQTEIPQQPQEEPQYTYGERAGQVAHGAATTYGSILDIPEQIFTSDAARNILERPLRERISEISKSPVNPEREISPSAAEIFPEQINKLYGKDLSPKDTTGKFLHGTGEILATIPIPGVGGYINAAKSGLVPLFKYITKQGSMAAGASAAQNLTPRITEEGTGAGAVEDIAKGLIGGAAGHGAPGMARNLAQTAIHPIDVGAAKLASNFIAPEASVLEKAAKHGIELPFNVGSNRVIPNHIANNALKTIYASEKYDKSLERSGKSLIEAVRKPIIEELGPANLTQHEASEGAREYIKRQEKIYKKKADVLYQDARKYLKNSDSVVPKHTLEALQSEPVMELISKISPSSSEKEVIKRIKEIAEQVTGQPLTEQVTIKGQVFNIENKNILKSLGKSTSKEKAIPAKDLIGLIQSLRSTLKHEKEIRGHKAFLSRLIGSLDADVRTVSNPEALKKYQEATKFFAEEVGERFRRKIPRSIIKEEGAKEAYLFTNSVKGIKSLEKIIGKGEEGKKVLDSLKKARVSQILNPAVQGNLHGEGVLNTQAFSNIFKSGKKTKDQELLRHLVGEKQYNNLSEVSDIAEEFAKSKKVLINTSGTAHVASDLNLSKDIIKETVKTLSWFSGLSTAGFSVAGPAGAAAGAASPYVLSRLLANPKFVTRMRTYALVRKQGNEKYANTLLAPLVKMTTIEIQKQNKEEE